MHMRLSSAPYLLSVGILPLAFAADRTLPALHDGSVIEGPGQFRHDGELKITGHVSLRHLTLDLHGPITVEAGATLDLNDVHLLVSDPPGAANGVSGLHCLGPAHIKIQDSTMEPVGSGHPMWGLKGDLEVLKFSDQECRISSRPRKCPPGSSENLRTRDFPWQPGGGQSTETGLSLHSQRRR